MQAREEMAVLGIAKKISIWDSLNTSDEDGVLESFCVQCLVSSSVETFIANVTKEKGEKAPDFSNREKLKIFVNVRNVLGSVLYDFLLYLWLPHIKITPW